LGLDAEWERGHWNVQGELQKFVFPYTVIPTLREQAGYAEVKRVLQARWYVAARGGYTRTNVYGNVQCLEAAAGFRPDRFQLIKFDFHVAAASSVFVFKAYSFFLCPDRWIIWPARTAVKALPRERSERSGEP
jgi:hypothetical protein